MKAFIQSMADVTDAIEIVGWMVHDQSGDLEWLINNGDNDRLFCEISYLS